MDITLERILSLIPKRPDGEYLHGAKKEFAQSIGYSGGEIINMWESGDSKSYLKKIHEISSKYDVSLDWLMGKTDEKKAATIEGSGPITPAKKELLSEIENLTEEEMVALTEMVRATKKMRGAK